MATHIGISLQLQRQLSTCVAYPEKILFLDIETTGLSHYYDEITVVGWCFGGIAKTIVKGQDPKSLREDAVQAKSLITFNGIRFDAKFIAKEFPDICLPETHVDLMYLCRRVDLKGGQKAIEKLLDIDLRGGVTDIGGAEAVILWHQYLRGDENALRKLILYNRVDIAAMGAILDAVMFRLSVQHDFFLEDVQFQNWSAPLGWQELPEVVPAPYDLAKKHLHFLDLFGASRFSKLRVVGIDLTGSEARASGWCCLDGAEAKVDSLFSDKSLVEMTVRANPDLVSIDSPLCLPAGRVSVHDNDPGRKEYGIMRECERELKRRGVNVYPCLIRSMQNLTARGIGLACMLRKRGIPVIESYPGAAQDIMRIPRKGAGPEWLRKGLREFGITGDYETGSVTHDELDAITSALVGLFHLAGMSEALGTDREPPLIIPRLQKEAERIVVGICGPIAAGKTTLARALEQKKFAYTRFSLVIDEILADQGKPLTRATRQILGEEVNLSGRQRWLCERTIARVDGFEKIVVDGLRFPDDYAYFVERFGMGFSMIFVDADEDTRRLRYGARNHDIGFKRASDAAVEGRVRQLQSLATEVFVNQGTFEGLEKYAEKVADFGSLLERR